MLSYAIYMQILFYQLVFYHLLFVAQTLNNKCSEPSTDAMTFHRTLLKSIVYHMAYLSNYFYSTLQNINSGNMINCFKI